MALKMSNSYVAILGLKKNPPQIMWCFNYKNSLLFENNSLHYKSITLLIGLLNFGR